MQYAAGQGTLRSNVLTSQTPTPTDVRRIQTSTLPEKKTEDGRRPDEVQDANRCWSEYLQTERTAHRARAFPHLFYVSRTTCLSPNLRVTSRREHMLDR